MTNMRGRTVFSDQPKRLPADIDRLHFYNGTVVRKKSLSRCPSADELQATSAGHSGDDRTPRPGSAQRDNLAAAASSSSTPRLPPRGRGEGKGSMQHCPSAPVLSSKAPPPPIPAFPTTWRPEPSIALRPVTAAATTASEASPALRPKLKTARERSPFAVLDDGSSSPAALSPEESLSSSCLEGSMSFSDQGLRRPATAPAGQAGSVDIGGATPHRPLDPKGQKRRPRPKAGSSSSHSRRVDGSRSANESWSGTTDALAVD
mmetsp:Transcript_42697/g.77581  ORF Transcript_42697/g.77581 Transcript_42697/m.77581 type:complete len:261 (+) Transcript_42697:72-854(+)